MTLIVPVGESSLPFVCDADADSSCLLRSAGDIVKDDSSDECVTPNLKRHEALSDDKKEEGVDQDNNDGASDEDEGKTNSKGTSMNGLSADECSSLKRTELSVSLNCDKEVSSTPPLVIYECKITLDSIPNPKYSPYKNQSTNNTLEGTTLNINGSPHRDPLTQSEKQSLESVVESCEESAVSNQIGRNCSSRDSVNCEDAEPSDSLRRHTKDVLDQNFKNCVNGEETLKDSPTDSCSDDIPLITNPTPAQVGIPKMELGSVIPSEDKKMKYKKIMQRRSVSESCSNDADFGYLKKTRDKLRHSFSAYENCDKLQRILDRTFIHTKGVVLEAETDQNGVNEVSHIEDSTENADDVCRQSNASLEKIPRKSCFEITDTLVNNVKKSMIEEYKNLKKNSSLANYNSKALVKPGEDKGNVGYPPRTVKETLRNPEQGKAETEDQVFVSPIGGNTIPVSETRCKRVNEATESASSFGPAVSDETSSDLQHQNLILLSDANDNPWVEESKKNISSPPTRLEIWKNILAEKRNSIRNHIKGLSKLTDNYTRSGNNNNINNNNNNDNTHEIVNNPQEHNGTTDSLADIPFIDSHPNCIISSDTQDNSDYHEEFRVMNTYAHENDGGINNFRSSHANSVNFCSLDQNVNETFLQTNKKYSDIKNTTTDVTSADRLCIFPGESSCSPNIKDSSTKIKLRDACHGLATAFDSLPRIKEPNDSINNNEPRVLDTSCSSSDKKPKQNCVSVSVKCEKNVLTSNKSGVSKSNIGSFITTIGPPVNMELIKNEKGLQCPTPPTYISDDEIPLDRTKTSHSTSTEDDSDYCQTDECGDDCDYCSGAEAEDEEEDVCDICIHQNVSLKSVCKHTRVMTNGSLKPLRKPLLHGDNMNNRISGTRSMVIHSAFRRRHINHQELSAIREYSVTSDDQLDTDEESHDDNMYDISSSWRFGLYDNSVTSSGESTLKSDKNIESLPSDSSVEFSKMKSNSLPAQVPRYPLNSELSRRPGSAILKRASNPEQEIISSGFIKGVRLPPRPPRTSVPNLLNPNPRPTMGLQGLQQRPSASKLSRTSGIFTGPKTLAPRSPVNPNPPFGFPSPPSPPGPPPASPFAGRKSPLEIAPSSPRTNSRSGALVTRNFSISDDEGGQRLSRRQVTITRHESAYKEAADKGYLLPPSSPIDPYWLTWKLGVLQKTVEDVGSRLEESEKVVGAWGPVPQDQNLADQYVHNVRKFRETLPDLQRGVDDVNDQAARFSAHNVPLTPANSAALHDLNNRWKNLETTVNDRWRQMAGRSREVTPLTPAQLASSVSPPWERATATNKVPYYINHAQETTHWDHPQMMDLLDSLSEFNHIKFSAYRTATKLRSLQKKLSLDYAKLQLVTDVFDEHGLRGQNDRLIDVNDMIVVLSTLYGRISSDNSDVNTTMATDLCLNWLLNVYDSQRTGQMRVLSFRIGLICLCRGHLEEKYRYMFRLIADPNRLVDQRKLGLLLHDCVQVPRQLGEVAAFGGSNIEPSVRSCFTKAGKDRETIEAVHFLTWVQQEPQSLVWLAVLHRVAASENVQHQVKCNICKTYPIVGLRYRCLKCLSFDMCQRCFFEGRSTKSHKITHPMHEYCTATTAGDEMKDFTKALKNKFKSKRSLQKHTKKGYLPVQTVLEGDPLESPSPSPSHNVSSQDMHSRLELYASRLAEVELRTNSNSTPDSEDEHGLIAQYCQSLSSSDAPFPVPKSPLQIMASVDADQKDELEQMIRDLEEENRALQAEYERLKSEQPSGSISDEGSNHRSEAEMLAEAKLLREHKGRLEARMAILEDHNRQLEAQLQRLRQLLVEQSGMGSPNKSGTLQTKSVTASQLAMDSPAKINGHSSQGGSGSAYEGLDQMSDYVRPPPPPVGSIAHMGNLFSRAGDLEKAVGNLVASMNQKKENDSRSDDHSDENDYDNTTTAAQSKSD